MEIILASQSPRRATVLREMGIGFKIVPSDFDGDSAKSLENNPARLVETLALEKARVVRRKNPQDLVIGADSVVVLKGKIIGKPKSKKESRAILLKSSGKANIAYTGIAIIYKNKEQSAMKTGIAKFKNYSEKEVDKYLKGGNPLDKTGGYAE